MQADLARTQAIEEPPLAVVLLNRLESRELAVRVHCNPDKRSYGIFLSETGATLLKELREVAAQSDQDATAMLSAEERRQLIGLLRKIYR